MGTNSNVRVRAMYLLEILTLYSDETHILSMAEICKMLEEYGIVADRRSVLADIKAINKYNFSIVSVNKPKKGYYVIPKFDNEALYQTVKALYSSIYISEEQCNKIIASQRKYMCQETADLIFNTSVSVNERNESYPVDREVATVLREGIINKLTIELTLKVFRLTDSYSDCYEEKIIKVNPQKIIISHFGISLCFTKITSDKKLYCINFSRIASARLMHKKSEEAENPDFKNSINYFTGKPIIRVKEAQWIYLLCSDDALERVSEYFGPNLYAKKSDKEGWFVAKVFAHITYTLYGWLCEMGDRVKIIEPKDLFSDMML